MLIDLAQKTVLVTGGDGFVGRHVQRALQGRHCRIVVPSHATCDLREKSNVRRLFRTERPDVVIHLAAVVGGIGANQRAPGTFLYDNALMGLLVQEQARQTGVEKFVGVGTVCEYPRLTPVPFRECDLWNGYPEVTNAPYGIAKKLLLVQGQAYRAQYGFSSIHLLPANLYGPGDDCNPETSHVIPALIQRCLAAREAGAPTVTCWGTGTATREFFYVADAAEAIVRAVERYDAPEPLNLGTGEEMTIRTLAQKIAAITGYVGQLVFDPTKPDGQPRRCLDISQMRAVLGLMPRTSLDDGLRTTVDWYVECRAPLSRIRA